MLTKEDYKKFVIKPENCITDKELTKKFNNFVKEIIIEEEKANYPHPAGHDIYLKQSRIYSLLSNQVIGCERY
jgi:hypothetical protein